MTVTKKGNGHFFIIDKHFLIEFNARYFRFPDTFFAADL